MPNWCENRVTIRGAAEKLAEITAALMNETQMFSFARILPMPDDRKGSVMIEGWYSWRISHWNTKWDAYAPVLTEEPGKLIYDFDTAWSPPTPVIVALAKQFPDVHVTHAYVESGMMFGGLDSFTEGELDESFESEDFEEIRVMSEWHAKVLSFDEPEEQEAQEAQTIEQTTETSIVLPPEQVRAFNAALGKFVKDLADLAEELKKDTSSS